MSIIYQGKITVYLKLPDDRKVHSEIDIENFKFQFFTNKLVIGDNSDDAEPSEKLYKCIREMFDNKQHVALSALEININC